MLISSLPAIHPAGRIATTRASGRKKPSRSTATVPAAIIAASRHRRRRTHPFRRPQGHEPEHRLSVGQGRPHDELVEEPEARHPRNAAVDPVAALDGRRRHHRRAGAAKLAEAHAQ